MPGVYRGGIQLRNSSVALLRPGIYVLDGGGIDVGAQASFCSISDDVVGDDLRDLRDGLSRHHLRRPALQPGTTNGGGAMGQVTVERRRDAEAAGLRRSSERQPASSSTGTS